MIDKDEAERQGFATAEGGSRLAADKAALQQKLKELLPQLVNSDGLVDVKALQDAVDVANSRSNDQGYELTFAGKGLARAQADSPTDYELKTELEQSKDFDNTKNVVIRGDNIEVLKILYQNYFGKIKMIYIDPPYNTQSDEFVYKDNFKQSDAELIEKLGMKEETADFLHNLYGTRSHSGWLTFMYPRLRLARELLREDGVMFISIDDNELANLKLICGEIFGEDNVDSFVWHKSGDGRYGKMKNTQTFRKDHEYVIVAYKSSQKLNKMLDYPNFQKEYGNPDNDSRGNYKSGSISLKEEASNVNHENYYEVVSPSGKIFRRQFDMPKEEFDKLNSDGRIYWGAKQDAVPSIKIFMNEKRFSTPSSLIRKSNTTEGTEELEEILPNVGADKIRPKPVALISLLVQLATNESDIVLDFFAGSGTTGEAVMRLNEEDSGNRKFILVQWDEEINGEEKKLAHKFCQDNGLMPVISSITIERLNRAGKKIAEEGDAALLSTGEASLDIGYKVYSIVSKPKLAQETEGGETQLTMNVSREKVLDTLTNMLCATCKPLDTPIETLIENVLYKADNEIYLLGKLPQEKLREYKDNKINLDGWSDIDFSEFLNLGFHDEGRKESLTIVY